MREIVVVLDKKYLDLLGSFRCNNNLRITIDENYIWLKGISDLLSENIKFKQLPVKNTYTIDEKNNLFEFEGLAPVGKIKELQWLPLSLLIKAEPPTSAMPGKTNERINIKLILSREIKESKALLTSLIIWKEYAKTASLIRLQAVEFAVSEAKEVLIIGRPLPPLPGKEYWGVNDILLPCGYNFEIPLVSEFINEKINKNKDSIIIFNTDSTWQKIDKRFFVRGKRSAVRLTGENNDRI